MKLMGLGIGVCLVLPLVASVAYGGDAERGKRVAQTVCAACHIVAPNQRDEIADAPPFAVIGSRFGFDPDMIVFALVGPHQKMNFGLRRPEADDVAAYIATLGRQTEPDK
jgi:mono/diheme cytochrome c family protein